MLKRASYVRPRNWNKDSRESDFHKYYAEVVRYMKCISQKFEKAMTWTECQKECEWTWEELEKEVGTDGQIPSRKASEEFFTIIDQTVDEDTLARNYVRGLDGEGFKA